ncbi:MAG: ATP-binding protein, partial [Clostridia bacterium]|nr:ATP-binding protein [Clostridia bacterium]
HVGNAERIGLIPAGVSERVMVVGNASLAGAVRFLIDEQGREEIRQILERCDYVELSSNADFATGYVERMIFE